MTVTATRPRRKYVSLDVDVNETVDVDIDPEEYPELVEWAEKRSINGPPSLALDTIWMAYERLKLIASCPASESLDRGEMEILAGELRDVWERITRTPEPR